MLVEINFHSVLKMLGGCGEYWSTYTSMHICSILWPMRFWPEENKIIQEVPTSMMHLNGLSVHASTNCSNLEQVANMLSRMTMQVD